MHPSTISIHSMGRFWSSTSSNHCIIAVSCLRLSLWVKQRIVSYILHFWPSFWFQLTCANAKTRANQIVVFLSIVLVNFCISSASTIFNHYSVEFSCATFIVASSATMQLRIVWSFSRILHNRSLSHLHGSALDERIKNWMKTITSFVESTFKVRLKRRERKKILYVQVLKKLSFNLIIGAVCSWMTYKILFCCKIRSTPSQLTLCYVFRVIPFSFSGDGLRFW